MSISKYSQALFDGILIFNRLFKDLSIDVRSVKTSISAFGAWRMAIEYTTKIIFFALLEDEQVGA